MELTQKRTVQFLSHTSDARATRLTLSTQHSKASFYDRGNREKCSKAKAEEVAL